ncbi:MAG: hypothetical protein WA633_14875 [Stellaceae bacterium]|jgi:hypothetical protein
MVYAIDDGILLRLWTVIRMFSVIRDITDPETRAEILTTAQIHLTAFALGLTPLPGDQASAVAARGSLGPTVEFDA